MKNRKDIIKNILIVFLVIMLILTFFSNTIMNHSLAQVSTSYINGGSINTSVRGSGTVTSVDPYSVSISEGRKIKSVKVKRNQEVSKGDVLFELTESESTEVTDAQAALNAAKLAYDNYIISNMVAGAVVTAAENKDAAGLSNKMQKLTSMVDVINSKQDVIDAYTRQLNTFGAAYVDTSALEAKLDILKKIIELENDIVSLQSEASVAEEDKVAGIIAEIVSLDNQKNGYYSAYPEYKGMTLKQLNAAQTSLSEEISNKKGSPYEAQITEITYQKTLVQNELDEIKAEYDEINLQVKQQMELEGLLDAITEAENKLATTNSKNIGDTVVAPISGTITDINFVAGETASKGEALCTITPKGSEYSMQISVTKEQAVRVKVGDTATIANSWYYQDIQLTVTSIKNDQSNPNSGNKIIVLSVSGEDVSPNQALSVVIGDKSVNYDMVVPNTAIREDKDGTYVLIVTSKNTPLGNRYTATRMDVKKLASDETNTAISCPTVSYESVITTATKPVGAGDQVRLAD